MRYFVYVLKSQKFGKYYIGHTNDLARRLSEHNGSDQKGWSRSYAPWEILHSAEYISRAVAMKEEKRLKSFKNKDSLAKYIGQR